jgi:phage major head subunit gpT-like protein
MAIIESATLNTLRTSFKMNFEEGKTKGMPEWDKVATMVASTSKSNTYGWLGQWPQFREWIGERQHKSLKEYSYVIQNRPFESSVEVDRDDIEDEEIGNWSMMMSEMGHAAEVFPDELVFPLLPGGFSSLCYDGQFFFDTDHPVNSEVDGSGVDESVSNVIIDPLYTGPAWYILDTSRALKPLIYQNRRSMQFVAMDNPDDERVYANKEFRYGVDCRANAGYGFWQMAIGVKAELNYNNVWLARERLRAMKADGGRSLGLGKNQLMMVVTHSNWRRAEQVNNREDISDGNTTVSNELKDKFEVLNPDFLDE